MKQFRIDIFGLRNKKYRFEYDVNSNFFQSLKQDLVENGSLKVMVDLDKNDRFIALNIAISGNVKLTCDRSLDHFDHPIDLDQRIIFKYGDTEQELSEDMIMITSQTQYIDVGHHIFEFIGLALPMKKLHPRYTDEKLDDQQFIYSSSTNSTEVETDPDPRWKKLEILKKK